MLHSITSPKSFSGIVRAKNELRAFYQLCEKYASETNLQFSTDPDPAKSKSKCIFMTGHLKTQKPLNLHLYGVDLPFVQTASHLGHQLSEECTLDQDIRCRKGEFISSSTEIREMFSFAQPNQILQAVKTYCCSMHNCMTWRLYSDMAGQFFRCWSTRKTSDFFKSKEDVPEKRSGAA